MYLEWYIYFLIVSVPGIVKCCLIFSTSVFKQWRMVIAGQTAKAHSAKSIEFCGSMVQARVCSHTLCLQVPHRLSHLSLLPWDVALKSHSIFPSINFMVHKEYFCLKCWAVPSLCKNRLLIIKSGWDFENSSEIMSRNFNTAYLSWFI